MTTRGEVAVVALIASIVLIWIYAMWREQNEWEKFLRYHDCKVIGHKSGQMDSEGRYTLGQTQYKCDDGQEYWR